MKSQRSVPVSNRSPSSSFIIDRKLFNIVIGVTRVVTLAMSKTFILTVAASPVILPFSLPISIISCPVISILISVALPISSMHTIAIPFFFKARTFPLTILFFFSIFTIIDFTALADGGCYFPSFLLVVFRIFFLPLLVEKLMFRMFLVCLARLGLHLNISAINNKGAFS